MVHNEMSYTRGFLAKTATVIFLSAWATIAQADFKIVTIGDSLAKGFNADAFFSDGPNGDPGTPVPKRSSFRPFLAQSIENFLNNLPSGPSPIDVDWIGNQGETEITPAPGESVIGYLDTNPNDINPNWRIDASGQHRHGAIGGTSSLSYAQKEITPLINSISGQISADDTVVATILLGTNDLIRTNHSTPVVTNIGNHGVQGYVGDIISDLMTMKSDIQVLVAGIPPVGDWRTPLDPTDSGINSRTEAGGFAWTEAGRGTEDLVRWSDADGKWIAADGNPDDPGAPADPADVNDVVMVINEQLADLAASLSNVKYVDPFTDPTTLTQFDGSSEDVDGGGTFDVTNVWPAPFPAGENTDLEDGLHLNAIGDQYYAGAYWNQGLQAALSEAIEAAVPEPSSFLFLGLLSVVATATRRFRRQR